MKMRILGKKRAVSPVIAVVLLIALTVAAAAIIWVITGDLLGTGTTSFVAETTSTDTATGTWTGKITVSTAGVLQNASISTSTVSYITSTIDLVKGSNPVTLTFSGVTAGTYTITFTFFADGSDSQTTETLSVTFA